MVRERLVRLGRNVQADDPADPEPWQNSRILITPRKNARDAIRTHEPLQEWILSPSELAGLSYPRKYSLF